MSAPPDSNGELNAWALACETSPLTPEKLARLAEWLAADETRRWPFMKARMCYRRPNAIPQRHWSVRLAHALYKRYRYRVLRWRAPRSDAPPAQRAWEWLQQVRRDPHPATLEAVQTICYEDMLDSNDELHREFRHLLAMWEGLLAAKLETLCAGMPLLALPPINNARELEQCAIAEGARVRVLRNLCFDKAEHCEHYHNKGTERTTHLDCFGNSYSLEPGGHVQVRLTPQLRTVRLLAGSACINTTQVWGWPARLYIEDACVCGPYLSCFATLFRPQVSGMVMTSEVLTLHRPNSAPITFTDLVNFFFDPRKDDEGPLPPSPADAAAYAALMADDAPSSELRAQAEQHAVNMLDEQYDAELLNELRTWLAADERHLLWFRHYYFSPAVHPTPLEQLLRGYANTAVQVAVEELHEEAVAAEPPPPLPPQVPPQTPAVPLSACALREMSPEEQAQTFRCLCASVDYSSMPEELQTWMYAAPARVGLYFRQWQQWHALLAHQFELLKAGMPTEPLPELASLGPNQLAALTLVHTEQAITLRRLRFARDFGWRELATDIGEIIMPNVPGMTCLTLNTATRLRLYIDAQQRKMELLQGEVSIDLEQYEIAWPLQIICGRLSLECAQAAFVVRRFDAQVLEVHVIVGSVEVRALTGAPLDPAAPTEPLVLLPLQRLRVSAEGVQVWDVSDDEMGNLVNWMAHSLEFVAAPLEHVVEELNRYRKGPPLLAHPAAMNCKLSGTARLDNEQQLFDWLREHDLRIEAETLDGQPVLRLHPLALEALPSR